MFLNGVPARQVRTVDYCIARRRLIIHRMNQIARPPRMMSETGATHFSTAADSGGDGDEGSDAGDESADEDGVAAVAEGDDGGVDLFGGEGEPFAVSVGSPPR